MMQRMVTGFVLAALVVFIPASVLAQQGGGAAKGKRSDDCAEQRKHNKKGECTLVIGGEEIGGEKISPDGEHLMGRAATTFGDLVRIRNNFADKMIKDAENL